MKSISAYIPLIKGGLLLSVMCLMVCLLAISDGRAETQNVTVNGMAESQDSLALSRDNAIKDGLRKAVEQAVGMMMSSETVVENATLVRDNIYNKSQGYIKRYEIVKETPDQKAYVVTVLAVVDVSDLKSDLGALGLLQARVGNPRTMFMITEQRSDQNFVPPALGGEIGTTETILKEEFLSKEFNVIDRAAVIKLIPAAVSDASLRETGHTLGAEIVVRGTATVKEGPRTKGSSVGSYLADVTAVAIRVDNGQVMATGRGHGVARQIAQNVGENSALELAARDAGSKLTEQIIAKWITETASGQQTQVTIRGLNDAQDLLKIRQFLASRIRGIQSITQRGYDNGVAVLDINAKANAQQLSDTLTAKPVPGTGLILNVVRITDNTLEILASSVPAEK